MRIVPMPGDGRCMFHAVAYACQQSAETLVRHVVAYYQFFQDFQLHAGNRETVADWIHMDSSQSVDDYCRDLLRNRKWGGAIDLVALTRITGRSIEVLALRNRRFERWTLIESASPQSSRHGGPIRVLFNGVNHYDALEE